MAIKAIGTILNDDSNPSPPSPEFIIVSDGWYQPGNMLTIGRRGGPWYQKPFPSWFHAQSNFPPCPAPLCYNDYAGAIVVSGYTEAPFPFADRSLLCLTSYDYGDTWVTTTMPPQVDYTEIFGPSYPGNPTSYPNDATNSIIYSFSRQKYYVFTNYFGTYTTSTDGSSNWSPLTSVEAPLDNNIFGYGSLSHTSGRIFFVDQLNVWRFDADAVWTNVRDSSLYTDGFAPVSIEEAVPGVVALSTDGRISISNNGTLWTPAYTPVGLSGVTGFKIKAGNGKVVVLPGTNDSKIYVADNDGTFHFNNVVTLPTYSGSPVTLTDICYNIAINTFLMIDNKGRAFTSPDAINWTLETGTGIIPGINLTGCVPIGTAPQITNGPASLNSWILINALPDNSNPAMVSALSNAITSTWTDANLPTTYTAPNISSYQYPAPYATDGIKRIMVTGETNGSESFVGVYFTSNGGKSWIRYEDRTNFTNTLYGLTYHIGHDRWILLTQGTPKILSSNDNGASWEDIDTSWNDGIYIGLETIYYHTDGYSYIAGNALVSGNNHIRIIRSNTGASGSWTEVANFSTVVSGFTYELSSANLRFVSNGSDLYLITGSGHIVHTSNGVTWNTPIETSLAAILATYPHQPANVVAATMGTGVCVVTIDNKVDDITSVYVADMTNLNNFVEVTINTTAFPSFHGAYRTVAYGKDFKFILAGDNGCAFYSLTGREWFPLTSIGVTTGRFERAFLMKP